MTSGKQRTDRVDSLNITISTCTLHFQLDSPVFVSILHLPEPTCDCLVSLWLLESSDRVA